MATITLNIPNNRVSKYEEVLNFFIMNYDINELEKIKNQNYFSKKMYEDYKNDIEWQKNIWKIQTIWKNKKELLSELNNTLWN